MDSREVWGCWWETTEHGEDGQGAGLSQLDTGAAHGVLLMRQEVLRQGSAKPG